MKVLAVCIGKAQPIAAKSGYTGHFKIPQKGAVQIGPYGVAGDTIVDTANHGGLEQALYLFGEMDRAWWEAHLDHAVPAGYFGENLLIDAVSSADIALGDIFEIGELRLQITAPRIPCVTFNARIKNSQGIRTFLASGRPGAYARVLQVGTIRAGDSVVHVPYQGERISIPEHLHAYANGQMDADYLRRVLTIPAHHGLHKIARDRLALGGSHPISK